MLANWLVNYLSSEGIEPVEFGEKGSSHTRTVSRGGYGRRVGWRELALRAPRQAESMSPCRAH